MQNEITLPEIWERLQAVKVKNFQAAEWCPTCKKVKAYSCTFLGTTSDDPDAQELPEMCRCGMPFFPHE